MTNENWPVDGEIDIIENVHSSTSNQVAFHTNPGGCLSARDIISNTFEGCMLTPGNFSGVAGGLNCDATINYNIGCGIVDASVASFGETFNAKGGGIYAMKWDSDSIDICKHTINIFCSYG